MITRLQFTLWLSTRFGLLPPSSCLGRSIAGPSHGDNMVETWLKYCTNCTNWQMITFIVLCFVLLYVLCIYLHFSQSNDKESNAPTEHQYQHCSTHDGHNSGDCSVVLRRGGNSSLRLCSGHHSLVLKVKCVIEAVWRVEMWNCQSTGTW